MADFTLEMLPAREGDCLLLTYRDAPADRDRRVLIDAGRAGTWVDLKTRLEQIPDAERELELLVISHVDRDHIEGVLKLLDDEECPVTFKEIWFNGFRHLAEDEQFGPVQGEKLTTILVDRALPWNTSFGTKAVCIPASGDLPVVTLSGGLRLTVVSPNRAKLEKLIPTWIADCQAAGLDPSMPEPSGGIAGDEPFGAIDIENEAATPYPPDRAEANGSSIALLAEYGRRRVLLGADAHSDILMTSLSKLGNGEPVELDAWKIAHHGSAGNTSKALLEHVRCSRYLVSTSGAQFKHPHRIAIARLIRFGKAKEIIFNYASDFTKPWATEDLVEGWHYVATYPAAATDGWIAVDI